MQFHSTVKHFNSIVISPIEAAESNTNLLSGAHREVDTLSKDFSRCCGASGPCSSAPEISTGVRAAAERGAVLGRD